MRQASFWYLTAPQAAGVALGYEIFIAYFVLSIQQLSQKDHTHNMPMPSIPGLAPGQMGSI